MTEAARLIAGTVVDGSGHPVPRARVYFTSSPGPVPDVALLTGADGRFVLSAPRPGRYGIGAGTDSLGTGSATVVVGPEDASVQIRLAR